MPLARTYKFHLHNTKTSLLRLRLLMEQNNKHVSKSIQSKLFHLPEVAPYCVSKCTLT